MEKTYKGKICVITGGTSGIGLDMARQLGTLGATVFIGARNVEKGEEIIAGLRKEGYDSTFLPLDVASASSVEQFFAAVVQAEGHVDYVFHSAGIILGGEIRDHKVSDVHDVLTTNVIGTGYVSFYAYKIMAEQGFGHLINLSSAAGVMPIPLMGVYSSSKFMVFGLGEVLRMEAKGLGVRVSTAVPGIVDTPIYDTDRYSGTDRDRVKKLMKKRAWTISSETAARRILQGTAKNRAFIHTQLYVRLGWMSYRYFPHIFRFFCRRAMVPYRKRMRD